MSNVGIVTGLKPTSGGLPGVRQEIRDLKKNADVWNIYLLGLRAFKNVDAKNNLSYFQMATIHGAPYQEWPRGDQRILDMKVPGQKRGFCTHSSILFLTWHRPYLALFESTLYDHMKNVAAKFTEAEGKSRYVQAIKDFRMPYWDWARGDLAIFLDEAFDRRVSVIIPASLQEELKKDPTNIIKSTSGGLLADISNPLYNFTFPADPDKSLKVDSLKLDNSATTQRYHSDSGGDLEADQKKQLLLEAWRAFKTKVKKLPVEANLMERVVYLLQSYDSFKGVSHNRFDTTKDKQGNKYVEFGSFEDLHNVLHNLCGGMDPYYGHMGDPAISAFDPIFWLHHTNIDRLFAIWQGLHDIPENQSDRYVTKQVNNSGTYITKAKTDEDAQTRLAPFYKDNTEFWNSEDVKSTTTFAYVYPETQNPQKLAGQAYRDGIIAALKRVYPGGSFANLVRRARSGSDVPAEMLLARAETLAQVTAADAPNNTATLMQVVSQSIAATQDASAAQSILEIPHLEIPVIQIPQVDLQEDLDFKKLVPSNKYLEWLVDIKAQKHALGGQFAVHVFLGPVEETNPALYPISPNHVGTFTTFGSGETTGCLKCLDEQAANFQVTGQIPLTIALVERYFARMLPSLEPADVVPYLQRELHWRVVTRGDGLLEDRSRVQDLVVAVISNEATIPVDDGALPVYSPDITMYPEVTTKADETTPRGEGTGYTG